MPPNSHIWPCIRLFDILSTIIQKQCQPKLGIAFPFIRCKVGSPSGSSLVFVFAIPSDPWRPVPPGASHARFPRNLFGGYEVPLHNESQKSKTLEANYIFSNVTCRTIIQTYRILKIEGEGFGYVQWFIHLLWCMMMLHILESSWGRFEQCLEIA